MDIDSPVVDLGTRPGRVTRTEGPTQDQWEIHRVKISTLYPREKLGRVREIMRRDHGFEASEKMYKTRVRHWGLDKKAKADEMAHALRIIERRKGEGKSTYIVIRERKMDDAAVLKYFRRQKISKFMSTSRRNDPAVRTPPAITYCTPPSTSWPGSAMDETLEPTEHASDQDQQADVSRATRLTVLRLPPTSTSRPGEEFKSLGLIASNCSPGSTICGFKSQYDLLTFMDLLPRELVPLAPIDNASCNERALASIRDYYCTYFQSPQWEIWIDERLNWDKRPGELLADEDLSLALKEIERPARIVGSFQIATRLYGTNNAEEAYSIMNQAFEKFGRLIREQHPQLLTCLLLLICLLDYTGFRELTSEVLFHIHDMAYIMLGSKHHITRLASLLAQSEDRNSIADRALQYIRDQYRERAGHLHPSYLGAVYNHAWIHFQSGRLDAAKNEFRRLHNLFESYAQFDCMRAREILYSMAQIEAAQGSLETADDLLAEAQRRIARRFGTTQHVDIGLECLRLRATLRQDRSHDIFPMLSEALEDAEISLGSMHPTVVLLKQSVQTGFMIQHRAFN